MNMTADSLVVIYTLDTIHLIASTAGNLQFDSTKRYSLYTLGPVPYRILANRTRRVNFASGLHSHY